MQKSYEEIAVLATIDPVSQAAGTADTDVIDMSIFEKVLFVIKTGVMATNATLDFVVKGDTASGGSFSTTVTGKSITQLTQAGTDGAKQVLLEVDANSLAVQGFRYIRGTLTAATAASLVSVVALGFGCSYGPASQHNLASVDEIVG